ncbi:MAG: RsmE family RNA methyltransferase [Bacteroidota bacterium]
MPVFYHPDISDTDKAIVLSEEESIHCNKVLRLGEGGAVDIFNGNGEIYKGIIQKKEKKHIIVAIKERVDNIKPRNFKIHIAIAPTKNIDRIEWFTEKAIEIGVDKISFLLSRYSERKHLRIERINKIAVSAMKQSRNPFLPQIVSIQPFEQFFSTVQESERYIAYENTNLTQSLAKKAKLNSSYCVIVGPEGGFSETELKYAQSKKFKMVSLGENRLRTETAGIVTCNVLNMIHLR